MTPCEMLLYRVDSYRRGVFLGSSVALIRADNEQEWLAHWNRTDHASGCVFRVTLAERYPIPAA